MGGFGAARSCASTIETDRSAAKRMRSSRGIGSPSSLRIVGVFPILAKRSGTQWAPGVQDPSRTLQRRCAFILIQQSVDETACPSHLLPVDSDDPSTTRLRSLAYRPT